MKSFEIARQLFGDGLDHLKKGNHREAEAKFLASLELIPERASTLTNLSAAQFGLGKFDEALASAHRATSADGNSADAWLNWANALYALRRYGEALGGYDRAIALRPGDAQVWSNKGAALCDLNRLEEALAHHDRAIALDPTYAQGWTNKGLTLRKCGRHHEALAHHSHAIALKPDYAEAWSNMGLTLVDLQRREDALGDYDRAIALNPCLGDAWANRATALVGLRRYEDAVANYERALALLPDSDSVRALLIHAQLQVGDWRGLDERIADLVESVAARNAAVAPFALLSVVDSPELQQRAARQWVDRGFPADASSLPRMHSKKPHDRIRVGYFSADFHNHPVAYLTAELFEVHDRTRFEILGLSLRPASPEDRVRARLRKAFDRFIDLENHPDADVARLSRDLEIDIAVDLGGHTADARTRIFAYRAAPVQVNYLGYPGTMGATYMDYIVADRTVIPEEEQRWYSEKIVYLPGCFQCNDSRRSISERPQSRQELGLPAASFVYCCFNNNYKVNPRIFELWMRILANTEATCLWLLANTPAIEARFRSAARKYGVDPDRLIFAGRVSPPEYRARFQAADLALDTSPYNAGTTASDALWVGLPVLTLEGRSFAGRMASSLLQALGLPELIARTPGEYERMAIELATNPDKARGIRQRLAANLRSTPLFDTRLFARHLEAAYVQMHERHQANLPPEHLRVEP
jgi:protein O-GlcNAc transferase